MSAIRVWSKQNRSVLDELTENGRYIAKQRYIRAELEEHANLVLEAYDWLVSRVAKICPKPEDVSYPVWVSYSYEATMLPGPGTAILELEIDENLIIPVNIGKWGTILNYSYIPADEEDAKRHKELLRDYGVDDQKAYMTRFYPDIKREITASWDRLFDDSIIVNNHECYGIVWEMKKEWLIREIK